MQLSEIVTSKLIFRNPKLQNKKMKKNPSYITQRFEISDLGSSKFKNKVKKVKNTQQFLLRLCQQNIFS